MLNQHQPPATNQSAVLFSQNKSALVISHQPSEHRNIFCMSGLRGMSCQLHHCSMCEHWFSGTLQTGHWWNILSSGTWLCVWLIQQPSDEEWMASWNRKVTCAVCLPFSTLDNPRRMPLLFLAHWTLSPPWPDVWWFGRRLQNVVALLN